MIRASAALLLGALLPGSPLAAQAVPPPEATEVWEPAPPVVAPGAPTAPVPPPSDAVILFDGTDLGEWVSVGDGSPAGWEVRDGVLTVVKAAGDIRTRRRFRSYQLHLEWRIPSGITGEGQARGNSGLYLAFLGEGRGGYELQILDSYENETYVNGMAGSVYKQSIPLANAARPPGEWQSYDVVWHAPTFAPDGSLETPARVTALWNGVLVQDAFELLGETRYRGAPEYVAFDDAFIMLQAHGDPSPPISFRNIWLRELPERAPGAAMGDAAPEAGARAPAPGAASAADPAPDTAYAPGARRVFTGTGEPASIEQMVAAMGGHDVVLIGETHDDPTAHAIEVQLLLHAALLYGPAAGDRAPGGVPRTVALSLESFERDVQPVLDEYLAGLITESSFLDAARPWPRYAPDYRPMVELAKQEGLDVIAANAPRRYVTRVSREGRESLSELPPGALQHLPPLPYGQPSPAYRDQWIAAIAEVMEQEGTKCGVPVERPPAPHGAHAAMGNQLHAQALWDATMAWSIAEYLDDRPDALVLHVAGGFHVARGTGIAEHLEAYRPEARVMTVMFRPVEDPDVFEPAPSGAWADYVVQTDEARTLEALECRAIQGGGGGAG